MSASEWSDVELAAELADLNETIAHVRGELAWTVEALTLQALRTGDTYGPDTRPASSEHALRELRERLWRAVNRIESASGVRGEYAAEKLRRMASRST